MDNISQQYDLVEYKLVSSYGELICEEPLGWKDDLMELKRSRSNYTTVTKYAMNLEFHGEGARFIKDTYKTYGFEERITLIKTIDDPLEMGRIEKYRAFIDGYSFKIKDDRVIVNLMESDMIGKIMGYKSEKVELPKTVSLEGDDIGELDTRRVNIIGKNLLLVSKLNIREGDEQFTVDHSDESRRYVSFPVNKTANSHPYVRDTFDYYIPTNQNTGLPSDGNPGNMFLGGAFGPDQALDVGRLTIDVEIEITDSGVNTMNLGAQNLYLIRYTTGVLSGDPFVYSERIFLASAVPIDPVNDPSGSKGVVIRHKSTRNAVTVFGQSYALAVYSEVPAGKDVVQSYNRIEVDWVTKSFEEGSQIDCVLPFELFDRLLRQMTGRTDTVLVSDYLGRKDLGYEQDGDGAYIGITSGFVARGFQDKPITTSFQDAIDSFSTIANLSYVVEKRGLQEYVRMEPAEYFFNNRSVVFENRVDTPTIKVSDEHTWSGIEIGYEKGANDYEEADGLDEYCGRITLSTPLSKSDGKWKKLSPYRADSVGLIFALRKKISEAPTEDTDYDDEIFLIDMKPVEGSDVLEQRVWQDDFSEEPIGLYDPDTATNLRLAPSQIIKKHYSFIKAPLFQYNNRALIFGSGVGNVTLVLDGESANRDIPISELGKEVFQNLEIEFPYDTDSTVEQALRDNIYGIFEFKDNNGFVRRIRLFDFKKNKYKGLLINGIQ